MKKLILSLCIILCYTTSASSQNMEVDNVVLIFKTHLDIGYTDFSFNVEKKYLEKFIPKAIETAQSFREKGGEERYVWTVGAWLIDSYLKHSSPEDCAMLEEAIRRGDICWNALPYTIESEAASKTLLSGMLELSAELDRRFGKHTIAAKMTDVPGHTRGIVPILADKGIKMLHIGVNGCSTVPEVPAFFRWQDVTSGKEIIMFYDSQYGGGNILPDGKTAVEISFTGDNEGPHTLEAVKKIYADLHKKYPNAKIVAGTLNDIAEVLVNFRDRLPVLTSEIGDTWIYGYASSPMKMARFRALSRLYSSWIRNGRMKESVDFAVKLGLVTEHTWGTRGAEVGHFNIYDMDSFNASRSIPSFRYAEMTWKEQEAYVDQAAEMLPEPQKSIARRELDAVSNVSAKEFKSDLSILKKADPQGRIFWQGYMLGGISYQSYSKEDYKTFQKEYVRAYNQGFDKVGLENIPNESHIVEAVPVKAGKNGKNVIYQMNFPETEGVDSKVYPGMVQIEYGTSGNELDMMVTILDKPAVRLPEALWVSFRFDDIKGIVAEKCGTQVDILDVVPGGNRRMHCIDEYVDIITDKGTIRITSLDCPIFTVGERNAIGYSRDLPNISEGVHFCLFNNLWSTNFNLWWEGSIRYRFNLKINLEAPTKTAIE